jgi:hypothetical protein
LGEITGATVSEAIIDRIFEKFCLGKWQGFLKSVKIKNIRQDMGIAASKLL